MAVEAEQRAWDENGQDRNHEVFPLLLDLREVLRSNGVPLHSPAALPATHPVCDRSALSCTQRPAGPGAVHDAQPCDDVPGG